MESLNNNLFKFIFNIMVYFTITADVMSGEVKENTSVNRPENSHRRFPSEINLIIPLIERN